MGYAMGRGWVMWAAGLAAAAVGETAAWAQETPGAIPDPSSYQGSMELQRQSDAQDAQFRAQQQQQSEANAAAYQSQSRGGGGAGGYGGGGRAAPSGPPWVPLAPAKNRLLGRWHPIEQQQPSAGGGLLDALASVVGGSMQGACHSMYGSSVLEYTPNALVSLEAEGQRVLNRLSYRTRGGQILVVPAEAGGFPAVVAFETPDRISVGGCPMVRVRAAPTATAAAPPPQPQRQMASAGPPPGQAQRPLPAGGSAVLALTTGLVDPAVGFRPFAGAWFYVLTQNPEAALARAGYPAPPGGTPVEGWQRICKANPQACKPGVTAMLASRIASAASDVAGRAQMPALPPGHYFLLGHMELNGRQLIWRQPIDLHAGLNTLALDPRMAAISP